MRTHLTRGLAAVLLAGALTAVAPPAGAETLVVRDARHDAQRAQFDADGNPALRPAPGERGADITRTQLRHGWQRVRLTITLRDLIPAANQFLDVALGMPGRAQATVVSFKERRGWQTFAAVESPAGSHRCRARTTARPARDRIVVTVPRRCLGRPAWVRSNVRYVTFRGADERNYVDAVDRSPRFEEIPATFGPKVFVG